MIASARISAPQSSIMIQPALANESVANDTAEDVGPALGNSENAELVSAGALSAVASVDLADSAPDAVESAFSGAAASSVSAAAS